MALSDERLRAMGMTREEWDAAIARVVDTAPPLPADALPLLRGLLGFGTSSGKLTNPNESEAPNDDDHRDQP